MSYALVEGKQGLPRQQAPAAVVHRGRHHQRYRPTLPLAQPLNGIDGSFGIEGIVAGLEQQQIGATLEQRLGLLAVGRGHSVKVHAALGRMTHVGGQRQRHGRRTYGTSHPHGAVHHAVGHAPCEPCALESHSARLVGTGIFGLTQAVRRECVRSYYVGTGIDIETMHLLHDLGSGETQNIVVAHKRYGPVGEATAMESLSRNAQRLQLSAHCPVEYNDSLGKLLTKAGICVCVHIEAIVSWLSAAKIQRNGE